MTSDEKNANPGAAQLLTLVAQVTGKPNIIIMEGQEYTHDSFMAYFYVEPAEPDTFMVNLRGDIQPDAMVINGQFVTEPRPYALHQGDQVRLLGVPYEVDIRETHMTYANSMFGKKIFTQTAFDMHPGQYPQQQDALGFYEEITDEYQQGLWIVADGVTNSYAGEAASRYAVEAVLWHYHEQRSTVTDPRKRLKQAIVAAGQALVDWGEEAARINGEQRPRRSATTLAAVALTQNQHNKHWDIALVGDSSVFALYFNDHMNNFTQSYCANHSDDSGLQKALGKPGLREEDVELHRLPVQPGSMILLVTDGVADVIPFAEHSRMLEAGLSEAAASSTGWPHTAEALVQRAIAVYEGYDNATALAIRSTDEPLLPLSYAVNNPQICLGLPASLPTLPAHVVDDPPDAGKRGVFGRFFKRK